MTYKGKFKPKNRDKYLGDVNNIVYRSLWERNTFRWLDDNDSIKCWNSEEVVIPYICDTDKRPHRYFMDVYFETTSGECHIVEIKPAKELSPPKYPGRKTKRYISESLTYIKNQSKWRAAEKYAKTRGWQFSIWTENELKSLGIKIILKG